MSTIELEYPPLIDTPAIKPAIRASSESRAPSARTALALVDVKEVALARFGDWRELAAAIVAKYKGVEFTGLETGKGYKALTDAIGEVRAPRFAAQNVSRASKSELAAVSKAIGAEEMQIAAYLASTERHLVAQRDAHDAKIAADKAERERLEFEVREAARLKEVARIDAHHARLAVLMGYVGKAAGHPAARIAAGMSAVDAIVIDAEAWEEFFAQACEAKDEALAGLRALHAKTLATEEADAERARVAEANRAEALRLAGIAAQQEAQAQVLAAQHAAQLKQIADGMAALAKAQKEADDRKATEARAVQDAQSEAAKLEAARVAALVPAEPVAALAALVPAEPVAVAPLPVPVTATSLPTLRLKDFAKMLGFPLPGAFIVDVLDIDPEVIGASALWTDRQAQSIFGALIEHVIAAKSAHGKSLVESQ